MLGHSLEVGGGTSMHGHAAPWDTPMQPPLWGTAYPEHCQQLLLTICTHICDISWCLPQIWVWSGMKVIHSLNFHGPMEGC